MLYNCHTHTKYSHDSAAEPAAMCDAAANAGLSGLLISDHCDCEYADHTDFFSMFQSCEKECAALKKSCKDLRLHFGIELGDPVYNADFAKKIVKACDFDAVLLSVHAVRLRGFDMPFSQIDFGDKNDAFIRSYLIQYFNDVLYTVQTAPDFDVLCHLTVPLRYITLKYGKKADVHTYYPVIAQILGALAARGKALEINTSALAYGNGFLMPDKEIAAMFLTLGGRYFTVGSDAHKPENVAFGLNEAAKTLKSLGVKDACCFDKRKIITYPL